MEVPSLLELLYSAVERSRTVQATVRHRREQARELEVLRRRGLHRELPRIPVEEGTWETPSAVVESLTEVWWARPDWLRSETTIFADGERRQTNVCVKQGEVFWARFGDGDVHTNDGEQQRGTMTSDEELLLDPSSLLGAYRFEVGGPTTRAGRPALAVAAERRAGATFHGFGRLADRLELVVDVERGVLLRVASMVDGELIATREIEAVVFDEPVDPDLFRALRVEG